MGDLLSSAWRLLFFCCVVMITTWRPELQFERILMSMNASATGVSASKVRELSHVDGGHCHGVTTDESRAPEHG